MARATAPADRERDGWELRFVAEGRRAQEMIELYRELGFEVVADPASAGSASDAGAECVGCRTASEDRFLAIYTRRAGDP